MKNLRKEIWSASDQLGTQAPSIMEKSLKDPRLRQEKAELLGKGILRMQP